MNGGRHSKAEDRWVMGVATKKRIHLQVHVKNMEKDLCVGKKTAGKHTNLRTRPSREKLITH